MGGNSTAFWVRYGPPILAGLARRIGAPLAGDVGGRRGSGVGSSSMFPLNWLSAGAGGFAASPRASERYRHGRCRLRSAVKAETRSIVEEEAQAFTDNPINEVSSDADKARFMGRYCRGRGRLYDFGPRGAGKSDLALAARSIAGTSLTRRERRNTGRPERVRRHGGRAVWGEIVDGDGMRALRAVALDSNIWGQEHDGPPPTVRREARRGLPSALAVRNGLRQGPR
jgi:hypothetical protein